MVVEYIRYEVPAEQINAFIAAYADAEKELKASSNCLAFEVTRGVEEPNHFIVRIEWDSVEGHLDGFRKGPHFPSFLTKVRPFMPAIREMKHYSVLSAQKK